MIDSYENNKRTVAIGDRVSFNSAEGYHAGTISDLRRDISNGELHAWVEVDHQWPGMFRAVPLKDIRSGVSGCI